MPIQPFSELLDESLDEAHFLWRRFEQELSSLTRNLDEIANWTEDRLQGALDGVRVAPDLLVARLAPWLTGEDPIQITVAAHLLATATTPQAYALLAETVRSASGAKLNALERGFALAELDGRFAPVTAALLAAGPEHKAALCTLKAFRRAKLGQEVVDVFDSNVPALQVKALHAASYLGDQHVGPWISAGLAHSDPNVRSAAIVVGIRNRDAAAWRVAVDLVRSTREESGSLLDCVAMFGGAAEQQAIIAAVDTPPLSQAALSALGTLGTREAVERCIAAMRDEALARIAGEAYCAVTGADLERDKLAALDDDAATPSFEDDDLDADLVPRGAATWPKPDVDAVARHWAGIQSRFAPGMRFVAGRPHDIAALMAAVESGPMVRRPQRIFETAVRTQNRFDVEAMAFTEQQRRMQQASRARVAA